MNGGLVAKIARQVNHADFGELSSQPIERFAASVARAVVDEDQFEGGDAGG